MSSNGQQDQDRVLDMLKPNRQKFVLEYLVDMSAGAAAQRIGYSRQSGYDWLKEPLVQLAIEEENNARQHRLRVTADRVVQELAVIGFSDITDYIDIRRGRVRFKDFEDIPPDKRRAIAEISEIDSEHSHRITFKLHPKMEALKLAAKHLGIALDRIIVQGDDKGGPVRVEHGELPPKPKTIAEWQAQVQEAEQALAQSTQDTTQTPALTTAANLIEDGE